MAYSSLQDIEVPGPKRDFVGYGRHVPKVRWPGDARIAISLNLNYEEGSERSHPAGDAANDGLTEVSYSLDPKYRDLAAESVFEYGSRAGVWRLERLLTEYKIPVTFFACAVALERNSEVAAWLSEAKHEPCCHGWRWEEMWLLSREEEAEHIRKAVASIMATCGERPRGWYCRYGASVNTRELLIEEGGFVYDSDAYNDDLPYIVKQGGRDHVVMPYTFTYNDGRFGLAPSYASPSDFLDTLKRGFDVLYEEGRDFPRMMSIGLHPRMIGQATRISALREFLDYVCGKDKVWFARRIDIAEWWREHHHEFA